jgi:hypothetical protein
VRALTTDELSRMQTTQESAMMDTCIILRCTDGCADEYGMPITAWVEGAAIVCGYDGRRHVEAGIPAGTPATQVALTDGRVRLPIETDISNLDRIELTHRFGVLLPEPALFEISGDPRRGPSGLLVDVRRVTSNG